MTNLARKALTIVKLKCNLRNSVKFIVLFFHSFYRSIIITSNTYGETAAYDRKRSESTYSETSGGKIPEEEFIDSQVVTSQHSSKKSSNCPQIQNQKRSTVAAIKVRFFAEKPHVEIEVNDNSPTL
jgi:hypothetical protein